VTNIKNSKDNKRTGGGLRQIALGTLRKPAQARVRELLANVKPGHCLLRDELLELLKGEGYAIDRTHLNVMLERTGYHTAQMQDPENPERLLRVVIPKEVVR